MLFQIYIYFVGLSDLKGCVYQKAKTKYIFVNCIQIKQSKKKSLNVIYITL